MAGETVKSRAVCLRIIPWSQTSHIVSWITPTGRLTTVVKGAVRPKSAFLGQYDLNYTCEIVYYSGGRGDLHPLRECVPTNMRDELRDDFRALALADYMRTSVSEFAPDGPDAEEWFTLLETSLDDLRANIRARVCTAAHGVDGCETEAEWHLQKLLAFELNVLRLSGLSPELEADSGRFTLRGERCIPVSPEVAAFIRNPMHEKKLQILLDAARVIGVFYIFHMGLSPEIRRGVLRMISNKEQQETERR